MLWEDGSKDGEETHKGGETLRTISNTEEQELAIRVENLKKKYRLGVIGSGTLRGDIQSFIAKCRKQEDPNGKIGQRVYERAEDFWALKGISFDIYKGETIGVIGGNGAGKSTLLRVLSRVTSPTEGSVYVKGRIASMLEVGTGFHRELTGRENIYLNGAIMGMSTSEVNERIDEIISFAEVEQFIDTPVKRYSSGMYVKLAFSVAAHLNADILIMDEVLAVGDARFQKKCVDKMRQLANEEGKTVLLVSHNMNTISSLCSRSVVLFQGEIQFIGDTSQAIDVYYQQRYGEQDIQYDLREKDRPANYHFPMRMELLEFLEQEQAEYEAGTTMKLRVRWKSSVQVDHLCFRITLFYHGTPMVTYVSPALDGQSEEGMTYETKLHVATDMLAKGKYTASVGIYRNTQEGIHSPMDYVEAAFAFRIIKAKQENPVWRRPWWGVVQLDDVQIAENKRIK